MFIAVLVAVILVVGFNQQKVIGTLVEEENAQICKGRAAQLGELIEKLHFQLLAFSSSDKLSAPNRKELGAFIQGLTPYLAMELAGILFAWPDGSCITSYSGSADVSDRDYFKAIMVDESNYFISAA